MFTVTAEPSARKAELGGPLAIDVDVNFRSTHLQRVGDVYETWDLAALGCDDEQTLQLIGKARRLVELRPGNAWKNPGGVAGYPRRRD